MKDSAEYIVLALMEGASLYREGAESILAEHDAIKRAEVLNEVADLWDERATTVRSPQELLDLRARAAELRRMAAGRVCDARFNEARCALVVGHDGRHLSPDVPSDGGPVTGAFEWGDDDKTGHNVPWQADGRAA